MISLENVDWDVVSAISNIVLSFLTFIGLMITLFFSVNNTFYKLKVAYQIDDRWRMKVINKRNIPVDIMAYGFVYKNNRGTFSSVGEYEVRVDDQRLEWNQVVRRVTTEMEIQNILFELKLPVDNPVLIYAFVKTQHGKIHKKKIRKVLPKQKEETRLTLD